MKRLIQEAELVEKLIEYKVYKYAAVELRDMQVLCRKSHYIKNLQFLTRWQKYAPPVDLDNLLKDVDLEKIK